MKSYSAILAKRPDNNTGVFTWSVKIGRRATLIFGFADHWYLHGDRIGD